MIMVTDYIITSLESSIALISTLHTLCCHGHHKVTNENSKLFSNATTLGVILYTISNGNLIISI